MSHEKFRSIWKVVCLPMVHAGHREEAVEVVHVHVGMAGHERVDGLVIVQCVSGTDELVCPADVMQ